MHKLVAATGKLRCHIGWLSLCLIVTARLASADDYILESPKDIPVAHDVDVVVVGGSGGAVECACEAARQGATVFLLAPQPYLGTDMCSTLRIWLEDDEQAESKLAAACFGERRVATPYAVKAAMDRALLESGVPYLTGCYATDLLRDTDGRIAGVVMANRSGRQAVRAKVVVDASDQAVVARMADVEFRPFVPGPQTFRRVVAGGPPQSGPGMTVEKKDFTFDSVANGGRHRLPVYEYTLQTDMEGNDLRSCQRAENRARDMTYAAGSELASEALFRIPSDTIIGAGHLDSWPGSESTTLDPFRPKDVARLYVLGAHSDLARDAASEFLRPLELMNTGRRIGRAAAAEAAGVPSVRSASLPDMKPGAGVAATVGEDLDGIRPTELGTIRAGRRRLPVWGRYDVVVVGGGTSGAPAGIAAAKSGARTLVVEYLRELGGVGTAGLIGSYWRGLRRGYTAYVDEQLGLSDGKWNVVEKAEWLRSELIKSGAEVWFGSLGCGAIVDDGQVRGVVVATPWGRGAVLANVVIDATGNADVAACAGAPTQYGISDRASLNVQIAGFPDRPMKKSYVNTCYTMVDDCDVLDVWHLMTWKRVTSRGGGGSFDVGQLVDTRERRRIVGDYMLTTHDILNHRAFPDTISQHYSNFDAAAFPDAELLLLTSAKGPDYHTDLPYRCLLPRGLDGMLVVGLGCSADRDAMTLIRMQPDLQNQGYAAGIAAAAAATKGGHTREINMKTVQQQLIREGVLDERVFTDVDSYPMDARRIEEAVDALGEKADVDGQNRLRAQAVIVAHRGEAIPLLRTRYDNTADAEVKLKYAQVLGILGDPTGVATLIEAVDAQQGWDTGVSLTSQRKTGNTFSRLDRLVIALGYTGPGTALPPLIRKLRQLEPDSELSHFKAISLALRHQHPCDATAPPLVGLLKTRGFTGHATVCPSGFQEDGRGNWLGTAAGRLTTTASDGAANKTNLNRAYKELITAAMLYRIGDREDLATPILEQYARDVHGHFARYAQRLLAGGPGYPRPGHLPADN